MFLKCKQAIILAVALAMLMPLFAEHFAGSVPVKANALFDSPLPTVPNDNFAAAQPVDAIPFHAESDITYATVETGEPSPYCYAYSSFNQSIWYVYTAPANGSLLAHIVGNGILAIYQGSALNNLTQIQCLGYWSQTSFQVQAGATYYFQVGNPYSDGGYIGFSLDVPPPPQAGFYYYPSEPSIYDQVSFYDNSYDPGNVGFQSGGWDFGNGNTSTQYFYVSHQFAADGDYSVGHTITTVDGRTGSTSQTVQVRTRDVYISKIIRPKSAVAGQTKKVGVTLTNKRYPQTVRVDFYKSVPGGFYQIGYLEQFVDANRKTDFYLGYTFTAADAQIGKVTIKAIATILDGRDALPADNEFISLPIPVKSRNGRSLEELAAADEVSQYAVDEESNKAADGPIVTEVNEPESTKEEAEPANYHAYIPLIQQ